MSSWGNNDNAANAPYWAVNSTIAPDNPNRARPTAANVAILYGNTRPDVYTTGKTIGLFLVDSAEIHAGSDNITGVSLIQGGTQYMETPSVSFSGGGGSSAAATATIAGGVVTKILVTNTGSSYETVPSVAVQGPFITMNLASSAAVSISTNKFTYANHRWNTGDELFYTDNASGRVRGDVVTVNGSSAAVVNTTTNIITATGHPFLTGDEVLYQKSGSNPIGGLTTATTYGVHKINDNSFALYDTQAHAITHDGTGLKDLTTVGNGTTDLFTYIFNGQQYYYVIKTGTNDFQLARTAALATAATPIDISAIFMPNNGSNFTLTSGNATAVATKGLGEDGDSSTDGGTRAVHTGWNIKTTGSGGRAGRVTMETLVALATVVGDGSDDLTLPDA